jgi:hypothetical protein
MALVMADCEDEARALFNGTLWPSFHRIITEAPYRPLQWFLGELDEYFNVEGARIPGQATREKLLASFAGSYQEELEEARQAEHHGRSN